MKQRQLNNGDWLVSYGKLSWTATTLDLAQEMAFAALKSGEANV